MTEWISVEDIVPNYNDAVLVFVNLGNGADPIVAIASYIHSTEQWVIHDVGARPDNGDDITHWMPLPEPPEQALKEK